MRCRIILLLFILALPAHASYIVKYETRPAGADSEIPALNLYLYAQKNFPEGYLYYEENAEMTVQQDALLAQQKWLEAVRMENAQSSVLVNVAVLDTGVDTLHEDLNVYGDTDVNGHGTKVAGIIGALRNEIGIRGLANAEIDSYQCFDNNGKSTYFDVASAIVAASLKNRVICIAAGGLSYSKALSEACDYAVHNNCFIVAAAGNTASETIMYPAMYKNVISAGALNNSGVPCNASDWGCDGTVPRGSAYGNAVDFMVLGDNILTTAKGGKYEVFSGTSAAAAVISGLAAYVIAENPDLSNNEVIKKIHEILTFGLLKTTKLPKQTDFYFKSIVSCVSSPGIPEKTEEKTETGRNYQCAVIAENVFSARRAAAGVSFAGKLWVIGGYDGSAYKNDIWYSEDGIEWECVQAPFEPRSGHSCVVFNGKLWLIGGGSGQIYADVWCSPDGFSWEKICDNALFGKRKGHSAAVFKDAIWLYGGKSSDGAKNDIWYSKDGIKWNEAASNIELEHSYYHSLTVFNNSLYILGGSKNYVSSDGFNYSERSVLKLEGAKCAVWNDLLWITGGFGLSHSADVWTYNEQGELFLAQCTFAARNLHLCIVHKDRLYLIAGFNGTRNLSDVTVIY